MGNKKKHQSAAVESGASHVPAADVVNQRLSPICSKCKDMMRLSSRNQIHHSYNSLSISAQRCHLCAQILAQIRQSDNFTTVVADHQQPLTLEVLVPWSDDSNTYQGAINISVGQGGPKCAVFALYGVQPDELESIQYEVRDDHTHSAATMDLAIGWFETCKTTHPDCAKASSAAPSRLLEIGDVDSDTPLRLRTSVFLSDVQYATLSHCWGKLKIVRLLQQNLDSFQQSIPLGDLPKTFQDAITIARQFKLQYIWIDSLCIIQDDKDDWRKEASLMANVYGGSTLNIAATGAVDGSEGLFFSRDKNLVRNTQVELVWTDTEDPLPNRFYHCVDGNLFDRHFTHSPLYKRAWCVQERILAPRTLHFGKTQIAWECQTTVRLETFPNMIPNEALGHFQLNDDFWFLARRRGMKMSWYSIVNSYSTCLLTMKSDKLIALSGVAQNLAAQIGGQYLYGHWTEYLPQSLLWMVTGRNYSRMDSNMAPSWSWASLDGPTWLSTSHDHVTFCSLEPSHEAEPTSQAHSLDAGRIITLKCKRLMQVFALKLLGKLTTSEGSAYTVSFQADRKPSIKLNFYFDEQQPGVSSQACYLLPVTHGVACEMCERGEGVNSEEGLVVEPVLGRKGCFRRLGVYETYGAPTKVFAGVRAHAWKQSPGRDECETYASVVPKGEDGMQWFTIKLI